MKKTIEDLAKYCNCTVTCVRPYLARAEFASARTSQTYIFNMSDEQLMRLRELVYSRNCRKGKYIYEEE